MEEDINTIKEKYVSKIKNCKNDGLKNEIIRKKFLFKFFAKYVLTKKEMFRF